MGDVGCMGRGGKQKQEQKEEEIDSQDMFFNACQWQKKEELCNQGNGRQEASSRRITGH